jgi:hypothetical protein
MRPLRDLEIGKINSRLFLVALSSLAEGQVKVDKMKIGEMYR